MNNIQKAFKDKQKLGLRAPAVQCMADGGQPSIGGFLADRFQAAKAALTPNIINTLRNSNANREAQALATTPPPVTATPAPDADPVQPVAFRFADGGQAGLRQQGQVKGPGTGTSDSVPAMLSKGEYVLPADTARKLGVENLDAIKDATHTPVNNGLRDDSHFANGGMQTVDTWNVRDEPLPNSIPIPAPVATGATNPPAPVSTHVAPAPAPVDTATVNTAGATAGPPSPISNGIRRDGNSFSNDFSAAGDAFDNAKNPVMTVPHFDIDAANKTAALQAQVNGLRVAQADASNPDATQFGGQGNLPQMTTFGQDLRAQTGSGQLMTGVGLQHQLGLRQVAGQLAQNQAANTLTARGQDITNADNQRSVGAALYGHDISAQNAKGLRQFELAKLGLDQANKNREYSLQSDKAGIDNTAAATNQLQKNLEAENTVTGPDGKPTFDAASVGVQRQGIDRAIADMGAKGPQDLSPVDQQRLLSGAHLLSRVQADATNWPIPWKPDYLKTASPLDLVGLKRLQNGDAQMRNGNVIPGRYIDKEGADRVGGVPTKRYDNLFAQGK